MDKNSSVRCLFTVVRRALDGQWTAASFWDDVSQELRSHSPAAAELLGGTAADLMGVWQAIFRATDAEMLACPWRDMYMELFDSETRWKIWDETLVNVPYDGSKDWVVEYKPTAVEYGVDIHVTEY